MVDVKIIEKKEQPLFSRTRVKGVVGFDASTPSRADLRKKVSESMKAAQDNVAIPTLNTVFGEKKANFEAHIYNSPADLNKYEPAVVLTRHGLRPKKAKAEKAAK
ncbi:hypothetical protein HYU11_03835 [Candidatus Woesearchaeota archaeon]|nr:hypothetical protein [Candidatus Woesearchaeota archaeon]